MVLISNTAAADEKIKGHSEESRSSFSLQDQMNFSQSVQDIESSGFIASSFKSSRGVGNCWFCEKEVECQIKQSRAFTSEIISYEIFGWVG